MKSNKALLITQALFLFCYQAFSYANEIAITFDDLPAATEESIRGNDTKVSPQNIPPTIRSTQLFTY